MTMTGSRLGAGVRSLPRIARQLNAARHKSDHFIADVVAAGRSVCDN